MITVACILLGLIALALMPIWGPILLISIALFGRLLIALICYPFELIDQWKRRRARGRNRRL